MRNQTKKVRIKIKQGTKIRSLLQREINSICPLCGSSEVGHFQIHHIDEMPENNDLTNLILLCPTCHSKITKGDITREEVERIKKGLIVKYQIECASITVDSRNCSWKSYENFPNAFINESNSKSPFPILNFSFINHTEKTVLLTDIYLKAKHLFSGFSGPPTSSILKSLAKIKISLPQQGETARHQLTNEIIVQSGSAFKFQVQIFSSSVIDHETYLIHGKKVLYFTFVFSSNISLECPPIFLNCKSENEEMKICTLS